MKGCNEMSKKSMSDDVGGFQKKQPTFKHFLKDEKAKHDRRDKKHSAERRTKQEERYQ
jgi:hypothetical protein